jgi:hypothetical protein
MMLSQRSLQDFTHPLKGLGSIFSFSPFAAATMKTLYCDRGFAGWLCTNVNDISFEQVPQKADVLQIALRAKIVSPIWHAARPSILRPYVGIFAAFRE